MVKSLDSVVILTILCASLLAFVVLYNLTNINITERIREIATIKVLGFFDQEVSSYVFRENVVLTVIGILAGLVGGIFLHQFVVRTSEVDIVMFERKSSCLATSKPLSLHFYLPEQYISSCTSGFAKLTQWNRSNQRSEHQQTQ